jgi:hypothetical protein
VLCNDVVHEIDEVRPTFESVSVLVQCLPSQITIPVQHGADLLQMIVNFTSSDKREVIAKGWRNIKNQEECAICPCSSCNSN